MKIQLERNLRQKAVEIIKEVENLNFRTALMKMDNINQSLSFFEKIILFSYQIFCYEINWDLDKKNLTYNKLFELCQLTEFEKDQFVELVLVTHRMRNNIKSDNYEEIINKIKEMEMTIPSLLEQSQDLENYLVIKFIVFFYSSTCFVYLRRNMKKNALNNLNKAIELAKNYNLPYQLFFVDNDVGSYFRALGLYEFILPNILLLLDYFEKNNNLKFECYFLNRAIGEYLYSNANLLEAKTSFDKLKVKLQNLSESNEGTNLLKCNFFTLEGIYYFYIGQYIQAIKSGNRAKRFAQLLFEEFGTAKALANALGNIGEAYFKLAEFELALKYQGEAFDLRKNQSDPQDMAESFYQLIQVNLRLGKKNQVDLYLQELVDFIKLLKELDVPYFVNIEAQYKISLARSVMQNKNLKSWVQAQELLQQALELRPKIELRYDALFLLIDISIQEYKSFENKETFEEIKEHISTLGRLSEKNPSVELKIHSYLIQSKLALISGKFVNFEEILLKAKELANNYNLVPLKNLIKFELEKFNKELTKWEMLISSNSSMRMRLDLATMENYVKDINEILSNDSYENTQRKFKLKT